ncbi:hypothetical protein CHUAL_014219 [Chamberlinius hualienensis]
MQSAFQIFCGYLIVFKLFGISFGELPNSKLLLFFLFLSRAFIFIIEVLVSVVCIFHTTLTLLNKYNTVISKNDEYELVVFPSLAFFLIIVWKWWVIYTKQNGLISIMKAVKTYDNKTKRFNLKITAFFATFILLKFTVMSLVYSSFYSDLAKNEVEITTIMEQIGQMFLGYVYNPYKYLLLIICNCFHISMCNFISNELDVIGKEIAAVKSPYRSLRIVEKSIEKYEKLEELSKAVNDIFSFSPFISSLSNVMAITMIVLVIVDHSENHTIGETLDCLNMASIICFTTSTFAIYAASRVNIKKETLLSAIKVQVASALSTPLHLIDRQYRQWDWIINHLLNADDWFNLARSISIDEELFITVLQQLFGYMDYAPHVKYHTIYEDKRI